MKIIVGLGNPGSHYKNNRHNVGFRCIDQLARRHCIAVKKAMCQSEMGRGTILFSEVVLAKPKTFVNLSGNAVACLLDRFHAEIDDLLVIHDDLDLSTGQLRIRLNGKSGGHRGVKSIIYNVGSESFCRLRIGISRPHREGDTASYENEIVDYVLGDPSKPEVAIMLPAIERACDAIERILSDGVEAAMNKYNRAD